MKLSLSNKIYIFIILSLLIVLILHRIDFTNTKIKYNNDIENYHQKNNLLLSNVLNSTIEIEKLNLIIADYKIKINKNKFQLDSLKILSNKNKQKSNEARNYINALSNRAVVDEFTKVFSTR
jgi:hypothetical protein